MFFLALNEKECWKSLPLKFPSTHKTIPSLQQKFSFLPTPYSNAIWKTLYVFEPKMKLIHFAIK